MNGFLDMAQVSLVDGMYIPTRYPNGCSRGKIPSDVFSAQQARDAQAAATLILEGCRALYEKARL